MLKLMRHAALSWHGSLHNHFIHYNTETYNLPKPVLRICPNQLAGLITHYRKHFSGSQKLGARLRFLHYKQLGPKFLNKRAEEQLPPSFMLTCQVSFFVLILLRVPHRDVVKPCKCSELARNASMTKTPSIVFTKQV